MPSLRDCAREGYLTHARAAQVRVRPRRRRAGSPGRAAAGSVPLGGCMAALALALACVGTAQQTMARLRGHSSERKYSRAISPKSEQRLKAGRTHPARHRKRTAERSETSRRRLARRAASDNPDPRTAPPVWRRRIFEQLSARKMPVPPKSTRCHYADSWSYIRNGRHGPHTHPRDFHREWTQNVIFAESCSCRAPYNPLVEDDAVGAMNVGLGTRQPLAPAATAVVQAPVPAAA